MKKIIVAVMGILIGILLNFSPSSAQVYVTVRPVPPVVVETRPVAPSPVHVWIEPEWRWHGGAYVYVPGYWARPHRHKIWVPGHWDEGPRGYGWVRGHWRRH